VALGSILLSFLSCVSIALGILLTPVPGVGAVFAFGAPALALAGIVLGGRALSIRRRSGLSDGAALVGVVLSSLCFFPALLTALTCGTCNALCATGKVSTSRDFQLSLPKQLLPPLPPKLGPPPDAGAPNQEPAPDQAPTPAPTLPPPPLAPGPR
jgi:hypothetical protein